MRAGDNEPGVMCKVSEPKTRGVGVGIRKPHVPPLSGPASIMYQTICAAKKLP